MRRKNPLVCLLFCVLVVGSCAKKDDDEGTKTSTCRTSDTAPKFSESDVTTPPSGVQQYLGDQYDVTKYLLVSGYNIHIFGTSTVSDWMMVYTYELARNMVGSILPIEDRAKFDGQQFFVITDSDPEIQGGVAGQRNTGNQYYTVINEALVCDTAVDTIRPDNAPEYRGWDTPIHEFGHAIELTLGLRETTVGIHQADPNYNESYSAEYFAWATELWFDARITGECGVDAVSPYDIDYFHSKFIAKSIWKPTCMGRP